MPDAGPPPHGHDPATGGDPADSGGPADSGDPLGGSDPLGADARPYGAPEARGTAVATTDAVPVAGEPLPAGAVAADDRPRRPDAARVDEDRLPGEEVDPGDRAPATSGTPTGSGVPDDVAGGGVPEPAAAALLDDPDAGLSTDRTDTSTDTSADTPPDGQDAPPGVKLAARGVKLGDADSGETGGAASTSTASTANDRGPDNREPEDRDTEDRDTEDRASDDGTSDERAGDSGVGSGEGSDTDASGDEPDEDQETPEVQPPPPPPDPEQQLASYRWSLHPETLHEVAEDPDELRALRDRLTEKVTPATDNATRARLLSLRAVVSRVLGELGKALADGRLALAHAEATGELRRIAIAQARLAHVHQCRGEFADADRLFELANSAELPDRLRVTMHEQAGRCAYEQGRHMEACNHFEKALELRKVEDPDLIARIELALDAMIAKIAESGLGPYPRSREEILQISRPPVPSFDEYTQRWGFINHDFESVVAAQYAQVQPFSDGVAWVRRPEAQAWELIDPTGTVLLDVSARFIGVASFSDGLAWVFREGAGLWRAIDKTGRVVIATGFDDIRAFRRGLAVVCRGGWGAVDTSGRVVVPMRYAGFATALSDGRYVEGFTDEGLAVVDSGNGKGVVDHTGRVVVQPQYAAIVIHPVAFLIGGPDGRWGALDRRGETLIDPVHPSGPAVMEEIDRLLADTKPVL